MKQRSSEEMISLLKDFVEHDPHIRTVLVEGSRANPNVQEDPFQDFDVSIFVTNVSDFKEDESWLERFGTIRMLQKPMDSTYLPSELMEPYAWLVLFEDGNRIDFTFRPEQTLSEHLEKSDGLARVMIDKDGLLNELPESTDQAYWIKKPTESVYLDCCNEFWWITSYVAKGLMRNDFLYAAENLNNFLRPPLLDMMDWEVGARQGYHFSLGKLHIKLPVFLPAQDWQALQSTYSVGSFEQIWQAISTCMILFQKYSAKVAEANGFSKPIEEQAMVPYMEELYQKWQKEQNG